MLAFFLSFLRAWAQRMHKRADRDGMARGDGRPIMSDGKSTRGTRAAPGPMTKKSGERAAKKTQKPVPRKPESGRHRSEEQGRTSAKTSRAKSSGASTVSKAAPAARVAKKPSTGAAKSSAPSKASGPTSSKAAKASKPERSKSAGAAVSKVVSAEASSAAKDEDQGSDPKTEAEAAPVARSAPARRADLGAPIDGFFEKQPPHLRPILEELRVLVSEAVPDATASIKWGMPFYVIGRQMMCALAGFKSHVNLILTGPPGAFEDPDGRLEGEAKIGRHLKLRTLEELPRDAVRGWLTTAAQIAREGGSKA